MKKLILLALLILTAVNVPAKANAVQVARPSAQLTVIPTKKPEMVYDARVNALKNIFKKYNSPLTDVAAAYVKYADINGVDWRLLPAISGVESTFGLALPKNSYNAYGWGNGTVYFNSWEDGISIIDQALKEKYMSHGATDVWSIGPIYAASPTWSARVNNFMNEIDAEYQKLTTFQSTPNI